MRIELTPEQLRAVAEMVQRKGTVSGGEDWGKEYIKLKADFEVYFCTKRSNCLSAELRLKDQKRAVDAMFGALENISPYSPKNVQNFAKKFVQKAQSIGYPPTILPTLAGLQSILFDLRGDNSIKKTRAKAQSSNQNNLF